MDGNGRWATQKGLKRVDGHKKGADVVEEITIYCSNIGLKYLTLYAFSTENWKRPKLEVEFLMKLLDSYLKKQLPLYLSNSVKFETVGDISKFSKKLQQTIADTKAKTANCTGLTQILALNYGSQDEIVRAIKSIPKDKIDSLDIDNFGNYLDTKDIPAVDMLIRTSGEKRISNFLLWQIAYAELFFTDIMWPDFNGEELAKLIDEYNSRERRFGGV